jgi:hypothetical protein
VLIFREPLRMAGLRASCRHANRIWHQEAVVFLSNASSWRADAIFSGCPGLGDMPIGSSGRVGGEITVTRPQSTRGTSCGIAEHLPALANQRRDEGARGFLR